MSLQLDTTKQSLLGSAIGMTIAFFHSTEKYPKASMIKENSQK